MKRLPFKLEHEQVVHLGVKPFTSRWGSQTQGHQGYKVGDIVACTAPRISLKTGKMLPAFLVAADRAFCHAEIVEVTPDANRKYQVSARIFDSMSVPHDYEHLFKNKVTPIDMLAAPFSNDPTIDWKKELSTFVICQDGEYEFLYRAKKLLQREKKYSWQPQTGSFLMAVVAASLYSQDRGGNSEVAVPFALVTVRSDKFTLTNEMDEHCEKLLELACQPLILQKQEDALNEEADNLAKAERARQMRFDQLESLPQSNNAGP